jgi:hypothetical protein
MTTFTEIVATVVVHSSAVALSHFGVTLEPTQAVRQPPPMERVVARTPAQVQHSVMKLSNCQLREPHPHGMKI